MTTTKDWSTKLAALSILQKLAYTTPENEAELANKDLV